MLTPQQSMRAQIDLAYIRERAMKQRGEDEDDISYDEETPCKRQCSSYLRSADLPREYFQPSPQVTILPAPHSNIPSFHCSKPSTTPSLRKQPLLPSPPSAVPVGQS